jgi:amphi-Trp domain-containing protein
VSGKKNKIAVKRQLTADELVEHLHALADSFASGRIVVEQGTRLVTMESGECVDVDIEAEDKRGKCKLAVSIQWRSPDLVPECEPLRILAEVPASRATDAEVVAAPDNNSPPPSALPVSLV